MKKFSFSVLALNMISILTSGLGLFAIARTMPQLSEVPLVMLAGVAMAGTAVIQGFINGGWRPFFLRSGEYSGAVIGGIATSASFISATAGWLMLFDAGGLQSDLQSAATEPHRQVLLQQEQKYFTTQSAFTTLSAQMQDKAVRESTKGPACDNDSPASWKKKCGPRCRFMNRSAQLTSNMSLASQTLAEKMSALALQLSTGSQDEIDAAYKEALTLPQTPEAATLRAGITTLKTDLGGTITDPDTKKSFVCRMNDTFALVTQAEGELSKVMTMPPAPQRPEPKIEDALTAAFSIAKAVVSDNTNDLRAAEVASFWLAFIVEVLLLLMLRRDARTAIRNGTEPLEPEEVDSSKRRKKLRNVGKVREILCLADAYTINGGKWGRYFAVPYDGDDSAFRTKCMEVVDYLTLAPSKVASSAIDMRPISPEWVTARAATTGHAVHYELYEWPKNLDRWRRFMRRDTQ